MAAVSPATAVAAAAVAVVGNTASNRQAPSIVTADTSRQTACDDEESEYGEDEGEDEEEEVEEDETQSADEEVQKANAIKHASFLTTNNDEEVYGRRVGRIRDYIAATDAKQDDEKHERTRLYFSFTTPSSATTPSSRSSRSGVEYAYGEEEDDDRVNSLAQSANAVATRATVKRSPLFASSVTSLGGGGGGGSGGDGSSSAILSLFGPPPILISASTTSVGGSGELPFALSDREWRRPFQIARAASQRSAAKSHVQQHFQPLCSRRRRFEQRDARPRRSKQSIGLTKRRQLGDADGRRWRRRRFAVKCARSTWQVRVAMLSPIFIVDFGASLRPSKAGPAADSTSIRSSSPRRDVRWRLQLAV